MGSGDLPRQAVNWKKTWEVAIKNKVQQRAAGLVWDGMRPGPGDATQTGQKIFLTYTLLLGFVNPIALITILYSLLIIHLSMSSGAHVRSTERRHSHKKVTKLVTLIIAVYIIFWLP